MVLLVSLHSTKTILIYTDDLLPCYADIIAVNKSLCFCSRLSNLTFRVKLCSQPTFIWQYVASIIRQTGTSVEHVSIEVTEWEHWKGVYRDGEVIDQALANPRGPLSSVQVSWIVDEDDAEPSGDVSEKVEKWLPETNSKGLLRLENGCCRVA